VEGAAGERTRLGFGFGASAFALVLAPVAAFGASDDTSRVITYVCKVDTLIVRQAGPEIVGTSCLDGMRYCNQTPGLGYCAPQSSKAVSKTCEWVGLGSCRSR